MLVAWTSLWASTLPGMLGEEEQRRRFSYALRKSMDARNVSARALGEALGVDARRVAAWREGRALPNLYESQGLATVLRVNEELFRNPPEAPPDPPYPLADYLLEAADSGAAEAHRRASTGRPVPGPGTHPGTPGRPARASGA